MQGAILSVHLKKGVWQAEKNLEQMTTLSWWDCRDCSIILQCYKHHVFNNWSLYATRLRDILNEWLTAAFCAFVRSDISVATMLRSVYCEQGTLRCCGRTYKLCVGEVLRGGIRMAR